jgi:hypothetical protein
MESCNLSPLSANPQSPMKCPSSVRGLCLHPIQVLNQHPVQESHQAEAKETYRVYRYIRMRMERFFDVALQDRLQSWRIREPEYSKTKLIG